MSSETREEILYRAQCVEATFKVKHGLYLVGSLEKGLTVYNQQVRAHNLIWALWELTKESRFRPQRIAVIGGGIAGLTAAACAMSRFTDVPITLFEQRWDLCPLQQGSDCRWLHPRIYNWPEHGSRAPGASVPVLNWTEGRASDVARDIIRQFGVYCDQYGRRGDRFRIYLGVNHLRITATDNSIEWIGSSAVNSGPFFRAQRSEGTTEKFDTIILAPGFGLETHPVDFPTVSYWRNEQHGQPVLNGTRQSYVVSGFGDGALIDLFRLTIERFRQDTILYELFDKSLDAFEEKVRLDWRPRNGPQSAFDFFGKLVMPPLQDARDKLTRRLRKDTKVIMHLTGHNSRITSIPQVFAAPSSFLNKFIFFQLYKCGAFSTSFVPLDVTIRQFAVPRENIICRHGTDQTGTLSRLFVDYASVEGRLKSMKEKPMQIGQPLWVPGCFPHHSQ